MGIWLKCTKRHKNRDRNSPFNDPQFFRYFYSQVYLGSEGRAVTVDGNLEVLMSFSAKDGILVKLKQNRPYRILFDYVDGAYYVNSNFESQFGKLIQNLSLLQKARDDIENTYYHVEQVVADFINENPDLFLRTKRNF